MVKPGDRKDVVAYLHQTHEVSVARACKTIGLSKSVYYYQTVKDDTVVIKKLTELAESKPTRGFPYYYGRIRNEGHTWNHKRVKRVYKMMNLNLRRKHRRRLPQRLLRALEQPSGSNITWSMDFMHDILANGRKVRIFNIIDDYNREAIAMEADYSHSGVSVCRILERIIDERGLPTEIRCDNGPEFTSIYLAEYANRKGFGLKFIQPGKPTQNAHIERFNRSYREDILDAYLFFSLNELRDLTQKWRQDYNQNHPHQSLKNQSPLNYLKIKHQI